MTTTPTPADEAFRLRFMAELQMQAAEMSTYAAHARFCRMQARQLRVRADLIEQGVPMSKFSGKRE